MPPKPTNKIVVLKRRRQSAPLSTYLRDTSLASLWSGCLTVQLACQLCLLTATAPIVVVKPLPPAFKLPCLWGSDWGQLGALHPVPSSVKQANAPKQSLLRGCRHQVLCGRAGPACTWETTREVKMRAAAAEERRCGRERPGSAF